MSGLLVFYILAGIAATVLFVTGYIVGIKQSLLDSASDKKTTDDFEDSNYTISISLAVIASASLIGLAGVNPIFIYLGPLLSIVTASMVGVAFFYERNMRKQNK
jgi:hypothetical protein